jgi:hypothetical protein
VRAEPAENGIGESLPTLRLERTFVAPALDHDDPARNYVLLRPGLPLGSINCTGLGIGDEEMGTRYARPAGELGKDVLGQSLPMLVRTSFVDIVPPSGRSPP